ncbi:hypothetical protein ABFV05_015378 [Capra hircus]
MEVLCACSVSIMVRIRILIKATAALPFEPGTQRGDEGVLGQGRLPRVPGCHGARAAGRSYPTSEEQWLCRRRRAERGYSTFKVRRGGDEEITLLQGKEQRLCFAGAAMKRYPTSKDQHPHQDYTTSTSVDWTTWQSSHQE